jgi:uncharacterized protein VirK/YbjX
MDCAPLAAPDMEAIPSKKRAEARRRYELLAQLAGDVSTALRAK